MERQAEQIIAGKYRLIRRLARGGMGSVWQAVHLELSVEVAIKFIRSDAEDPGRSSQRFRREARLLAQLRSPYIVQVLDFGVDEESPYLAMELLRGSDLGLVLESQTLLSPIIAFPLIFEAARGLCVAHRAGVIHRDIKPSNLFVTDEQDSGSRLKLIDFGIAKEWRQDSNETTQGLVLGSPTFMSPEQARGDELDESTDVWSLAAVAFKMLTGVPPLEGKNSNDTVIRICTETPALASARRPQLGTAFDELFQRAFARERSARIGSLFEFVRGWEEALLVHDPEGAPKVLHFGQAKQLREPGSSPFNNSAPVLGRRDATQSVAIPSTRSERESSPGASEAQKTAPSSLAAEPRPKWMAARSSGQGRDSETASISVARSAASAIRTGSERDSVFARWTWLMVAALLAMLASYLLIWSSPHPRALRHSSPSGVKQAAADSHDHQGEAASGTEKDTAARVDASDQRVLISKAPDPQGAPTPHAAKLGSEPAPSAVGPNKSAVPKSSTTARPQKSATLPTTRPSADRIPSEPLEPEQVAPPPTDPVFGLPLAPP